MRSPLLFSAVIIFSLCFRSVTMRQFTLLTLGLLLLANLAFVAAQEDADADDGADANAAEGGDGEEEGGEEPCEESWEYVEFMRDSLK